MKMLRIASSCLLGAIISSAGAAVTTPPATATDLPALAQRVDEHRSDRLLDKAVERFRAAGDAAFEDFNHSPAFKDRELYVYVLGTDGTMLASGGSSIALVGRNVADMRDAAGKAFFREMLETATRAGGGRVEYRWLNPADKREEPKVTLFRRVDERIIAVGYYVPRATPAQARALLERAAAAVAERGQGAITAFNSIDGGFIQDDLYVFAVDTNTHRFLAHGVAPALVGTDGRLLRDPKGKAIIADMLNISGRKGGGELEYAWRNPSTDKIETKHTFFRKVGDVLVGVGYYTR